MMKFCCSCFFIFLCFIYNASSAEAIKVLSVGGVPTAAIEEFNRKLENGLKEEYSLPVEFDCDFSMGYPQKVIDIFTKAKEDKASCILAQGVQLPAVAYKKDFPVPVIQFFWNEPSKPNPNIARLIIASPVDDYCEALKECGWQGGTLAIVMDEGSFFEDAQGEKLARKYKELFPQSSVEKIKVDSKTCAILMNLVSAYNMFKSKNIKAVYVSNSGNTSRIFPFILKVAKKLKVAVMTDNYQSLQMGGCFALSYNEDKLIKMIASLTKNETAGKHTVEPVTFDSFEMYCNPDNMVKYGLELPDNSKIKVPNDQ